MTRIFKSNIELADTVREILIERLDLVPFVDKITKAIITTAYKWPIESMEIDGIILTKKDNTDQYTFQIVFNQSSNTFPNYMHETFIISLINNHFEVRATMVRMDI